MRDISDELHDPERENCTKGSKRNIARKCCNYEEYSNSNEQWDREQVHQHTCTCCHAFSTFEPQENRINMPDNCN